jgi:hypothetical protein
VANFFENLGVFVKNRIIDRDLALDMWSYVILRNWNALSPIVSFVREDLGAPAIWENFEYLALLARKWQATHGSDSFLVHGQRMPEDRSFIEAVKRAANVA